MLLFRRLPWWLCAPWGLLGCSEEVVSEVPTAPLDEAVLARTGSECVDAVVTDVGLWVEGTTLSGSDRWSAPDCGASHAASDWTVGFVPSEDGDYEIRLEADFDATLSVAPSCNAEPAGCPQPAAAGPLQLRLSEGEAVLLVVDGAYEGAEGVFSLVAERVADGSVWEAELEPEVSETAEQEPSDAHDVELCADGFDNDGNNLVDCVDPACDLSTSCVEDCADGVDNDEDGSVDCADAACAQDASCVEVCDDGLDNDEDCLVDCADGGCAGSAHCVSTCTDSDSVFQVPALVRGSLTGRGDDVGLTCSDGGGADHTVAFTAPRNATYVFDASGSAFAAAVGLLDGCGGSEIACSRSGSGEQGHAGVISIEMRRGQTVYAVVDHAVDLARSHTCGADDALAHLGLPDSFELYIAERSDTEQACGQWRDTDVDGLAGCEDPDCADSPICRVLADGEQPIESRDPYCVERGTCDSAPYQVATRSARPSGGVHEGAPKSHHPDPFSTETSSSGVGNFSWVPDGEQTQHVQVQPATGKWGGPTSPAGEPRFPIEADAGIHMGEYADRVQIQVPPGPGGLTPAVAIVHNHRAGDTGVGRGFSLAAPSGIVRQSTHGGPPNQTEEGTSRFVLGGDVLQYTDTWTWEPTNRDGRHLVYDVPSNTFTAYLPGGGKVVYGSIVGATGSGGTVKMYSAAGRVRKDGGAANNYGPPFPNTIGSNDPATHATFLDCTKFVDELCNTVRWLPTLQEDAIGNQILFHYEAAPAVANAPTGSDYWYGDAQWHRLDEIEYGENLENRVAFVWESHPHPEIQLSSGVASFLTQRLADVEVHVGASLLQTYQLTYRDQVNSQEDLLHSYLHAVDLEAGTLVSHLRVYDYSFDEPTWSAAIDVTSDFDFDFGVSRHHTYRDGWENEHDHMAVVPANLNGDGRSDLMLLRTFCGSGSIGCIQRNNLAVATDDGRFDISDADATRWPTPNDWARGEQFQMMDLDGDGFSELVVRDPNASVIKRLDPYENRFYEAPFPLNYDIWSEATAIDMNGDGCTDLVRANYEDNDLVAQWYRNSCEEPYFEDAPIDIDWQQAFEEDWEEHSGKDWEFHPYHFDKEGKLPPWKLTDVNGDGMADLVVSLWMQWREHHDCNNPGPTEQCRYVPNADTEAFSRIYFGDGFGGFVDSGLPAGAPFTTDVPGTQTTEDRTIQTYWSVRTDLNGTRMLLGSRNVVGDGGQMDVYGASWLGIEDGEGFPLQSFDVEYEEQLDGDPFPEPDFGTPWTLSYEAPGEFDLEIDGTSRGEECFDKGYQFVMADFTGNGFADILEIHTEDTDPWSQGGSVRNTPCGEPYCLMLRKSTVADTYGRLTSVQMPTGGLVQLEWSHTADDGLHEFNRDLSTNVEVLTKVTGAQGEITYRYGHGAFGNGSFGGFGVVERDTHGFTDSFGFYTSPQLRGSPLWKARYGYDGQLERADVWVYGDHDPTGAGLVVNSSFGVFNIGSTRFNPVVRECIYEVERTGPDLARLLESCHGIGLIPLQQPSRSSIFAMAGIWRYPYLDTSYASSPGHLAREVWEDDNDELVHIRFDQEGVGDLPHLVDPGPPAVLPLLADLRWPAPDSIEVPPLLPLSEHRAPNRIPAEADGSGATAFITEFRWDPNTMRQTHRVNRRSGHSASDDITEEYFDQDVPGRDYAYRVHQELTYEGDPDAPGAQMTRTEIQAWSTVGADLPALMLECGGVGTSGERCVTLTYEYDQLGRTTTQTKSFADGTAPRTTTWDYVGFCGDVTMTPPDGNEVLSSYNDRCQQVSNVKDGILTVHGYDALGRTIVEQVYSGTHFKGGEVAPTFRKETHYDDDVVFSVSDPYAAPRSTSRSTHGDLIRSFEDEWGRATLVEHCVAAGATHVCDANEPIRREWIGHSTTGQEIASAPSYFIGETVAATRQSLDAYGRVLMEQKPRPTRLPTPEFFTTFHYVAPHRDMLVADVVENGVVRQVVTTNSWNTLEDELVRDGQRIEYRALNRGGEVVLADAPTADSVRTYEYDADMNLVRWEHAETEDVVDGDDTVVNSAMGESFTYNDAGEMLTIERADGTVVSMSYDTVGRLERKELLGPEVQADGSVTTIPFATLETHSYRMEGLRPAHKTTNRQGFWKETTSTSGGNLFVENSLGHEIEYRNFGPLVPGSGGMRVQETRRHGSKTEIHWSTYDTYGRLVAKESPQTGTTTFTYDGAGNRLTETDADGVNRSFVYSYAGPVLEEHVGGHLVSRTAYDDRNRIVAEESEGGLQTNDYDVQDRLTRIRYGDPLAPERTTSWTYQGVTDWEASESLSPTSAPGGISTWTYGYDAWGRRTSTTDPNGEVSTVAYDIAGRPRVLTDEEGYRRVMRYDWAGETVYEELPGRNSVTTTYDYYPPGATPSALDGQRVVTMTEADGATTTRYFDGVGREVRLVRADGSEIETQFDGLERQLVNFKTSDGDIAKREVYLYDSFTKRLSVINGPYDAGRNTEPAPEQTFGWTAAGRRAWVDTSGERTDYVYAADGRVATESYLGMTRSVFYETPSWGVGRRISSESLAKPAGATRTTNVSYDSIGRITEVRATTFGGEQVTRTFSNRDAWDHVGTKQAVTTSGAVTQTVTSTFGYDRLGRLTRRGISLNGAPENVIEFGYFANGVRRWHEGDSGKRVEFEYNSPTDPFDFELDRVVQDSLAVFEVNDRDDAGRPAEVHRPRFSTAGATTALSYDLMGRLTNREETDDATGIVNKRYVPTYNEHGFLEASVQEHYGATIERSFAYYGSGYLQSESWSDGTDEVQYDYDVDDLGKRTETARTDLVAGVTTLTTVGYDPDGLVDTVDTNAVTYNDWQEVVTNHDGTTITRDAMGLAWEVTVGADTIEIVRDADGLPVVRIDGDGTRITQFDPDDPGREPLEETLPSGDWLVFALGPDGTQRSLFDATGLVESKTIDSDAWSSPLSEDADHRTSGTAFGLGSEPSAHADDLLGYSAMQAIPGTTDLHVARYRLLDSVTGHFLRPDPIGLMGGDRRTLFAKANPVAYSDDLGLSVCEDPGVFDIGSSIGTLPSPEDTSKFLQKMDSGAGEVIGVDAVKAALQTPSYSGLLDIGLGSDVPQPWRIPCHYGQGWGCERPAGADGNTIDEGSAGSWEYPWADDDSDGETTTASTTKVELTPRQRRRRDRVKERLRRRTGRKAPRWGKKSERIERRLTRAKKRGDRRNERKGGNAEVSVNEEDIEEVVVLGERPLTKREEKLTEKLDYAKSTTVNYAVGSGTLTGDLGLSETIAMVRAMADPSTYAAMGDLFLEAMTDPETRAAIAYAGAEMALDAVCPVCTMWGDYQEAYDQETYEDTVDKGTQLGNSIQTEVVGMLASGGVGYVVAKGVKLLGKAKGLLKLSKRAARTCSFEPVTLIATPAGRVPIAHLQPGDLVLGDLAMSSSEWVRAARGRGESTALAHVLEKGMVLEFEPQSGLWKSVRLSDVPADAQLTHDGKLFDKHGAELRLVGSATRSDLRRATQPWRSDVLSGPPNANDWVWALNGRISRLEDVEGDQVAFGGRVYDVVFVAGDPWVRATGLVIEEVVFAYSNSYDSILDATIESNGAQSTLGVTANHPFYLPDLRKWVDIGSVSVGAELSSLGDEQAYLLHVEVRPETVRAHNITVTGAHNYFVGDSLQGGVSVLVHNDCVFSNKLPEQLDAELATAARVGVKPMRAGADGFDDLLNEGTIKWVVTESGELMVGPHTRQGIEISHAVLSNGAPVKAAGQANIASSGGQRFGLELTNHSGHFQPSLESLDIGREAFEAIGVVF